MEPILYTAFSIVLLMCGPAAEQAASGHEHGCIYKIFVPFSIIVVKFIIIYVCTLNVWDYSSCQNGVCVHVRVHVCVCACMYTLLRTRLHCFDLWKSTCMHVTCS